MKGVSTALLFCALVPNYFAAHAEDRPGSRRKKFVKVSEGATSQNGSALEKELDNYWSRVLTDNSMPEPNINTVPRAPDCMPISGGKGGKGGKGSKGGYYTTTSCFTGRQDYGGKGSKGSKGGKGYGVINRAGYGSKGGKGYGVINRAGYGSKGGKGYGVNSQAVGYYGGKGSRGVAHILIPRQVATSGKGSKARRLGGENGSVTSNRRGGKKADAGRRRKLAGESKNRQGGGKADARKQRKLSGDHGSVSPKNRQGGRKAEAGKNRELAGEHGIVTSKKRHGGVKPDVGKKRKLAGEHRNNTSKHGRKHIRSRTTVH